MKVINLVQTLFISQNKMKEIIKLYDGLLNKIFKVFVLNFAV
jgi:hypothetical protein